VTVGALTTADVGRVVTLRGTLGEPDEFSSGIRFLLDDGTGSIILLLWDNVYDDIAEADRLVSGAQVEVTGRIEEYRGDLEIVPEASGVRVVDEE
jgi:DNA/RNA endonuclease YhcR with UshA esterase domain